MGGRRPPSQTCPLRFCLPGDTRIDHCYPKRKKEPVKCLSREGFGEKVSNAVRAHAGAQHPEAVRPDVVEGEGLARGRVVADGWLSFVKEGERLFRSLSSR
jgi:hypothetical protein